MKLYLYLLTILAALSFQSAAAAESNVILHLNDTAKIPMLEKNVGNLRKELGKDANIRVIINGRAITAMLSDNKLVAEKVNSMLHNNAEVGLCHTSMRNNNIDETRLIDGVTILPDGALATIIQLQKEGYYYIKI